MFKPYQNISCVSVLLGALYEATGNHEAGYYFAGAVLLSSAMLVFLIIVKHQSKEMIVLRCERRCERQNSKTVMTRF